MIVDDEEPARALLREYLERAGNVEIVGECRNGFEAVKAVNDLAPDLVFLDVQMPKLNGFEVLELLGRDVAVVFVTAFDDHAIRAFDVHAVDYVLKPLAPERVTLALERARQRLRARHAAAGGGSRQGRPAGRPARLAPRRAPGRARARDPGREARLRRGAGRLRRAPLGGQVAPQAADALRPRGSLDPARFVRIHRSYLLNLDRLSRIESEGGEPKAVVLTDGTRLPLSRSGYGRLKGML